MSEDVIWVKVSGLDELQKKLRDELPKRAKQILKDALFAAAQVIKNEMMTLAPRRTGFLAEHIDVKLSARGGELAASAFIGPNGRVMYREQTGKGKVWIRKAVTVARWLEFGTSKMAAHPFMTTAFETKKQGALDVIIGMLKTGLGVD